MGDVLQTTDPKGNTTSFNYADNFYNYTPPNPTGAFITQKTLPTTNGQSHIERFQYYFNSGLVAAKCGQNFGGTNCTFGLSAPLSDYSTFTYDAMNRRLIAAFGDGGQN